MNRRLVYTSARAALAACLTAGILLNAQLIRAEGSERPVLTPEEVSPVTVEIGRQMYIEGLLPSGKPIQAMVQLNIPVTGNQLSCASCHRRSGLSFSEAGNFVPPIAGRFLYKPVEVRRKELWVSRTTGDGTRPAYTDETLIRAIREGVDPAGQRLDPLMPRYALSDEELRPLIAYLKTLSTHPSPGITEYEMHFATIVGAEVTPAKRKAMLDILTVYFRDKNAETRHETERSRRAPWHKDWVYQAYRKWVLHTWELEGPEETWQTQLDEYYRQQPVFAVLSGIVASEWKPIHEFCEKHEIPCLFPNTDLPVDAKEDFYSIYFSRGLLLEAETLVTYLADREAADPARIVQVFRNDASGRVAAEGFRKAWQDRSLHPIQEHVLKDSDSVGTTLQRILRSGNVPIQLVLWLDDEDLVELDKLKSSASDIQAIYLSGGLLDGQVPKMDAGLQKKIFLTYPFALPEEQHRLLVRPRAWLRSKGIEMTDERIQANTHFTIMLAGASIKHIIDNFSREYFVERIEHRTDSALTSSVYPRVTLAPGQRFASKGCYIVRLSDDSKGGISPVTDWIIP